MRSPSSRSQLRRSSSDVREPSSRSMVMRPYVSLIAGTVTSIRPPPASRWCPQKHGGLDTGTWLTYSCTHATATSSPLSADPDRKSLEEGRRVSVRVDLGGGLILKTQN